MAKDSTGSVCKVPLTVERGSYEVLSHQLFYKYQQPYPSIRFPARTLDNSDTIEMVEMPIQQSTV